jgi:hypothetical protein
MSIIRSPKPESNFYLLDKRLSEDKKLSWASRGLLIFLLGKPDNWRISAEYLAQQTNESSKKTGKQGIYSLLDELIGAGYVVRSDKQAHDEKTGFLLGYDYVVYDSPCRPEPYKAEPYKDKPYKAEPYKANHPLTSIDTKQGLNETSIDTKQGLNSNNSADAQKTTKVGLKDLIALGVEQQTASDWLEVRRLKRAALTQTVINLLVKESAKANISVNDAVRVCAENSWQGFKADWYFNLNKQSGNNYQSKEDERKAYNKAAQEEFLRSFDGGDTSVIEGVSRHVK